MTITIYLDSERKCRQIIRPKYAPKGIPELVDTVTRGSYHSYSVES